MDVGEDNRDRAELHTRASGCPDLRPLLNRITTLTEENEPTEHDLAESNTRIKELESDLARAGLFLAIEITAVPRLHHFRFPSVLRHVHSLNPLSQHSENC